MKSILTFLLIILMDIQFNYACPCSPTNTFIEMNESFMSQFQTATIIPMFLWQSSWSYPIEGLAIGLLISPYRILPNGIQHKAISSRKAETDLKHNP